MGRDAVNLDRRGKGLGLPRTPGRLLGLSALLCLLALLLANTPQSVPASVLLTCAQVAVWARAVRVGSKLWPLHALPLILTAAPLGFVVWLLLSLPEGFTAD